jgi:ketosteroid isomerase-like protein
MNSMEHLTQMKPEIITQRVKRGVSVTKNILACSLALASIAFAQKGDVRQGNRLAVVEAERAFACAAATKGTRDAFLEFLADDGIIFQPGPVNGKQFWQARAPRKGLLSWEPIFADVSLAGDLGYTTGPYEFRPNGADDKPIAFGQYFTIWKKQTDGSWKVALDRGTSNPQPSGPIEPLQFAKDERPVTGKVDIDAATGRALLLKLEAEFSNASSSQGIEKAFRFNLADGARLFRENSFPAVGKPAALAALSTRKAILTWQPAMADISRSGDLGYTYGTYDLKASGSDQKPEHGNYVRVWQRQTNGRWKVVIDILNPMPSS